MAHEVGMIGFLIRRLDGLIQNNVLQSNVRKLLSHLYYKTARALSDDSLLWTVKHVRIAS